jgi:thiamine-monophosphate kinase
MHICSQSGVGATIYKDNLPADNQTLEAAMEFKLDPITCILNGGEDYELLFTIPLTDFEKIKNHPDISIIGKVTDASEGINPANKHGQSFPLQAQGWTHF